MKLGIFLMASHPPERSLYDATQWDLEVIRYADELGYSEAWVGEHHTLRWEPIPSPDVLLSQAIIQTKRIRLGVGSYILPYHHPITLAHRIAYLDHLSQGRFMVGIGSGTVPTDVALYNIDAASGQNRRMTAESLEIMLKLWTTEEPFEYQGEFWSVNQSKGDEFFGPHIRPYQRPHPPLGLSGSSKGSGTLRLAGEYGAIPMSFGFNQEILRSHWETVNEGAKRTGKVPDRKEWRITQDILVTERDEDAYDLSVNQAMGRFYGEYQLTYFRRKGVLSALKQQPDIADEDVNVDYLANNAWIIGSPDTVAKRIDQLYENVGGFGTLLINSFDYSEAPDIWKNSMRLLVEEVFPRLQHNRKKVY